MLTNKGTNSNGTHLASKGTNSTGTNSTGTNLTSKGSNSNGTHLASKGTSSTGTILTKKTIIWETHCDNICGVNARYRKCCGSVWRFLAKENPIIIGNPKSNIYLEFPRVHGVILMVLSSLFVLSILEGLLELCVPFMPYRLLYSYTPIRFQQN